MNSKDEGLALSLSRSSALETGENKQEIMKKYKNNNNDKILYLQIFLVVYLFVFMSA